MWYTTRISKANQAFAMLRPIWRSTGLSIHTKIRIFKSNILSVLLYGSECWKSTTSIERKLEVFQNKCLRCILKIYWPNTISNEELRIENYKIMTKKRISFDFHHIPKLSIGLKSPGSSTVLEALSYYLSCILKHTDNKME